MNLREARCRFSYLVAEKLLPKARELDFEYAFDEVTNHQGTGHREGSVHYEGCAIDLLLYLNGVYQPTTEAHRKLGEYWESVDPNCKWGGRWGDGNHYSFVPFEIFGGRK
jgi:hypothetical protein